jgi:alkylhydroperoxidase family enzyme
MPWIHQVPVEHATGRLKQSFDAAVKRAGRVWNIVRIMSQNPEQLEASMTLYIAIMHGASPLTRFQRELLATVVSLELACRY